MRVGNNSVVQGGEGEVTLTPDETEDLWHIFNLVSVGDTITASTFRRVQKESSTGSVASQRMRVTLAILVQSIDFEPTDSEIRVGGINVRENQFVKMNAHHTLTLELNRKLTLYKPHWDVIAVERLQEACNPTARAEVAAVVMQEGLAHVCLVTESMTIVRQRLEVNIPRKRKASVSQHQKALARFYEALLQAIVNHIDFSVVKCVILASPGFLQDDFFNYIKTEASRQGLTEITENVSVFLRAHSSSGHKRALKEVMQDPTVVAQLADTKAAKETAKLEVFFKLLNDEPDRAYYGKNHVKRAAELKAVESLLVSEKLFRANDVATRQAYVQLVEDVRDGGGEVFVFSSLHVSGEQLDNLTGVAAILRYPLPEIEDEVPLDSDDEGDDGSGPAEPAAATRAAQAAGRADNNGDGSDSEEVVIALNEDGVYDEAAAAAAGVIVPTL